MSKYHILLNSILVLALASSLTLVPALAAPVSAPARQGPTWFDPAWTYRRPVVISSSQALSDYQVLITLDSSFDFTRAASDGRDVRIASGSGTAIPFWIETWNPGGHLARIWVRVPSIPTTGTTIYLYYGNPAASSTSNGGDTFEFFDNDWANLTSRWHINGGTPVVNGGIVSFASGATMQSLNPYSPGHALGFRGWFKTGGDYYKWGGFLNGVNAPYTNIGTAGDGGYANIILTNNLSGSRLATDLGNLTDGFHIYELTWTNSVERAFIDRATAQAGSLNQGIPTTSIPIQLGNYNDIRATFEVDWVYLRRYQEPEPTVALGAEEANTSADLGLTLTDSPDPAMVGDPLSYMLTISNYGPLGATGVVVTDTLPASVNLVSATPSQGNCGGTTVVVCNLGAVSYGGAATVNIVVTPAGAGTIVNSASVTGDQADYNTANNAATTSTIVNALDTADLALTLSDSPDPARAASPLTFTLLVANSGPANATGVTVTDTLPSNVTFGSATPSQGTCSGTSVVICNLGTLNSGSAASVTIVVTSTAVGTLTNQSTVSGNEPDPYMANNTATETTWVSAPSLGAIVLVNSSSTAYADFQHFVQPYLGNFGVPYTVLDIAMTQVGADVGDYALIIVGHRQLDVGNGCSGNPCLNSTEQANLTAAVNAGTGLVNFDNDLSADGSTARYPFIQNIFNFGYLAAPTGSGVLFTSEAGSHWITARHQSGETISTGSMTLAGITLPADATALATTGSAPFLTVRSSGQGRAVQWGTYNWMSHSVKGPIYGLDDLVWRSIAWAARKPFVMQGMPPFLTMRVDDESGPFDWIHVANEVGIKPWAGIFLSNIDEAEAADLSALVTSGQATTAIHAFDGNWFYWAQSDTQIAANFAYGTQWHQSHNIPISKYVLPHYYQFGSNAFAGLANWGVECVGTQMDPDQGYGAAWIMNGPYRKYESGSSSGAAPQYYADYMTIPGHPEFNGRFFNLVTEIRDDLGYEWYPNNDVPGTVSHGTLQTKRALDSMALATLFTHDQSVSGISMDNWRAILQGITSNLALYHPINVTMDYACQYIKSKYNSRITSTSYYAEARQVTAVLTGTTEIPTKFYLFMDDHGAIRDMWVDVPQFTGQTQVVFTLPGELNHIVVTPAAPSVVTGATQQFSAQGYDANNNPIPNLSVTWSVVNGGGTINSGGLFTAGPTPGTYVNTVAASVGAISGTASVTVVAPSLDHFAFQTIASPQYAGVPFQVTITARDVSGNLFAGYTGQATLGASVGNIVPNTTANLSGGTWTGNVTLDQAADSVTLTATAGAASGTSNGFLVRPTPTLDHFTFQAIASPQYVGAPFQLTITARDVWGNLFTGYSGQVTLGASVGNITPNVTGNLTGGTWTGNVTLDQAAGSVSLTAAAGVASGTSNSFAVQAAPSLDHFTFQTIASPQIVNVPFQIAITARDSSNTPLPVYAGHPALGANVGSITPNVTGDFVGSTWTGTVALSQVGSNVTLSASEGAATGTSNGFAVQPPPPYYQVSSDSYIQTVGVPFSVTVTAFQTTFNCWDDSYQDPVLTTTSDVSTLNYNSAAGQWTEFWYQQGNRPFPSVMASALHTTTLPTMHFYMGGIPNGRYQVIANLYDTNRVRYFYGYTSANPSASFVDSAGGATGTEHREYSLGTVVITDNSFNLYVNNAQLLNGGYDIFGWAWIRLAPAEPERPDVTINLYEDSHQDPVLATTTSVDALTYNSTHRQWTEFLYTSGRPYPSVMGSALYTPVAPTMHFYTTSIPNGQYQVYATLYDTNPLRYFYGYTGADPNAFYVDTSGGAPGTQHREYSLGTVDITNHSFDLYVNTAQELPGATYDIFGWAFIRLHPLATGNSLTLSSNSPTLRFDANGNGTFGEPGDNVKLLVSGILTITVADSVAGQATITATDELGQSGSSHYDIRAAATPPLLPSSFFGEVHLGNPPSVGDLVQAHLAGVTLPFTTAITSLSGGTLVYNLDVPGDVTGTPDKEGGIEGEVITFTLNSQVVALATWHSGSHTRLDLYSFRITLQPGWNLVSFNLHPVTTGITDVLASLAGQYDLVYAWDAATPTWLKYDDIPMSTDSLLSLNEAMGFWIHITGTVQMLDVAGSPPPTTTIPLVATSGGWNLVGYPAAGSRALPEALRDHGVGTDFSLVYAYHATEVGNPWKLFDLAMPPYFNDLLALSPGYGYWVQVSAPHTLTVTYPAP